MSLAVGDVVHGWHERRRLEPGWVVSGHVGAGAFCRICPVLVRLSMDVLFTELPKVSSDRLHLTDGEALEVAVGLQEFGLEVPTRRIEHPRAPPRVHMKWMLEITQVQRRQVDPLIGIEIPARPSQHVACPTREERLIRSFPGDSLICPLDRGPPEHPRRRHCHGSMLAKRSSLTMSWLTRVRERRHDMSRRGLRLTFVDRPQRGLL